MLRYFCNTVNLTIDALLGQGIEAMFLLSDIKQTRVYQEAKEEGKQEGEARIVLRILSKRFGNLSDRHIQNINTLALEQLEELGEALLDFGNIADLDRWLASHLN